jgi:hypothetical protein
LQQIATVVAPVTLNTDSNTPSNSGTTATVIDMERQLQQVVYQRHCAKHKSKPPPIVKIYSAELISMYTFVQGQRQAPNHLATAIQGGKFHRRFSSSFPKHSFLTGIHH